MWWVLLDPQALREERERRGEDGRSDVIVILKQPGTLADDPKMLWSR